MQAPYPPPHASPPQRSGAQCLRLLLRRQGVDKRIDFAVQHVVELAERQVDAMVGDAGLREVVSANSFRTVARADHRTAGLGDLRVLLLCWDFSSRQMITIPLGICVIRTAESVVLTL